MGRAPCCDKTSVKRGPWSPEEDSKLKDFIHKHGTGGNWISLPHKAGLKRCGKSCRLRWLNYLRPNIKHGDFSEEEDRIICSLYVNIGSRWSIIAAQLPGRTDNDIKNYWNTKLKKKLITNFQLLTKPSFSPSYSSNPFSNYFTHTPFIDHHTISLQNTSSNVPFYQNQDPYMINVINPNYLNPNPNPQMQYNNYSIKDNNMFMFGSDQGSCSSSDGSKELIKQEENCYPHNMSSNGFNDFMINCNNGNISGENEMKHCYEEMKSCGFGYSYSTCQSQSQTLTPLLDYGMEDIKQLISSNNNNGVNIDEIQKNEENFGMYYWS